MDENLDKNLKRKIEKVLKNEGNVSLASLEVALELGDKLEDVAEAIKSIPETIIPEYPEFPEMPKYPEEVKISNLPEIQKVEVTNQDSTKVEQLLAELLAESKKKEEYAYDIEIDSTLKEQLRGEKGEDGKDGKDGKDGTEIEAGQIVEKLESLTGEDRLDVSAIRGAEEMMLDIVNDKISKIPKPKKQTLNLWRGGTEGYTIIESSDATITASATTGTVIYLLDCSSGNITFNLPSAIGNTASIVVKKVDSSANTITLDATGSETIDGSGTYVINGQYYSQNLISSGGNWYII